MGKNSVARIYEQNIIFTLIEDIQMHIKDLVGKKVGIWGFGIVGKSAVTYLKDKAHLSVLDKRQLNAQEQATLGNFNITLYGQDSLEHFLQSHDFIIPSAGIDLRPFERYRSKWISELDIFGSHFKKPIIAITGTVGKTTTTHFLAHVLTTAGMKVACAGNIGTGLFDIIDKSDDYDIAVIEVSSFQLELCRTFAPHYALWTNFYPNHLDRHSSIDEYLQAKLRILAHQSSSQFSIIPLELAPHASENKSSTTYFSTTQPNKEIAHPILYIHEQFLFKKTRNKHEKIINIDGLGLFPETLILIAQVVHALHIPLSIIHQSMMTWKPYEHRLEKVTTINGIDFYNDSKSTIMEATVAAIKALAHKPTILLLGGLSKGVDRTIYFEQLKNIKAIICFGAEANQLCSALQQINITCYATSSLEQAVECAIAQAKAGDNILLSPGGSSYDLFKNYEERGRRFKELVFAKSH